MALPCSSKLAGHTLSEAWLAARPTRVIVAEDDAALRKLLVAELRTAGYDVIEVGDGKLLVDLLRAWFVERKTEPIDLVITDNRMPGWDGLTVLRSLRQMDWRLPVVMITAFGDEALHSEARELGAAAVFDKPFDFYDLRTLIMNTIRTS
jgi:DNA-binding response OmpR family regulator